MHTRQETNVSGMLVRICVIAALVAACGTASADDRADYNRRAAERDVALFSALDLDGDRVLTRDEARPDLTLGPRFNDADINRDGVVTREEMQRYVDQQYGTSGAVTVPPAQRAAH
jgi:hypothetical protein